MKQSTLYQWLVSSLVVLVMLGVCFTGTASAQDETSVSVSPPVGQAVRGQVFTVEIIVDPAVAIAGVQFDLTFDPSLITVNSVEEGNLLKQDGANTYFAAGTTDNDAGTITGVAGAITSPGQTVSSPGTFAIITFTAGTTDGASLLTLSMVVVGDKYGQEVPVQVNSGFAFVVQTLIQPGDANGDSNINAVDITKVERVIAELDAPTPGADANQDGSINALDITKVERIIAGLD